ncbi:autophagy-related protein 11-domain-containing protein [Mycena rebaudengoi]|nr:autophagy-related protein 11-domain-containing protein [Mycena rebaudengoi]
MEERNSQLSGDIESQRRQLATALADATEQSKITDSLRQELSHLRADFDEVKTLEARNSLKITHLLGDQANNLRILEEARARGENLEASREKDRLLRAQASEYDRIIRDHITEANGDRAVLERQFHELKAVQEHTARQLEGVRSEMDLANADTLGLREELKRVERELREASRAERVLRDDLPAGRASQSDYSDRLENSSRLIAQILNVASPHDLTSWHWTPVELGGGRICVLVLDAPQRHQPSRRAIAHRPFGPVLETLRAFDHDHFLEAITKTGSTIRKWQKQCKEYRERAKGKISFRNFAKGDLALFRPMRNSVSKPWAAFNGNVSFPHYFLQATGHLAELKTREWIFPITDPTNNPYRLGDGVKYYMLEIEDWTQPSQQNKRKVSSRKVSKEPQSPLVDSTPTLPPGPPEAEVEDSFLPTHHSSNLHLFPARTRSSSSPPVRPSSLTSPSPGVARFPSRTYRVPKQDALPPNFAASTCVPISVHRVCTPPCAGFLARRSDRAREHLASPPPPASLYAAYLPWGSASSGSPGAKAPPTTALADPLLLSSSPSSGEANPFRSPSTPSPDESMTDGVSNALRHSLPEPSTATTATVGPVKPTSTASNTPANLASSWGVSFGRRKKADLAAATLASTSEADPGANEQHETGDGDRERSASELLKRF